MIGFIRRPDGTLEKSTPRARILVDPQDGGRLTSLSIDGTEVLGGSIPPPGAPTGIFAGSFVMAPFVGRTSAGQFEFDGQQWQLPANFGDHAMHGFVFDRPWASHGEGIEIELDERWPFGGKVRQVFDLTTTSLTITATISNDVRPMPAILGFHPWFTRELKSGGTASLQFSPAIHYVTGPTGIPTGTAPGQGSRPWDDSFTDVTDKPKISWTKGPELTLGLTGSHWIVCETMPGALCIEPLSGPVNGFNTGEYVLVEPGRPLSHSLNITWR